MKIDLSPHRSLAIWQITESEEELLALLPRPERYVQAMQRFTAPHRRVEWLAVRVLLYTLLGEEKEIAYQPNGKPYLTDRSYSISISHTKGYAALILGKPDEVVGIDIEQYGERVQRVRHKFIRDDEPQGEYQGTTTWSLLLHWSAKETLYKCLGSEEVDFRDHLRIFPFTLQPSGSFQACEYKTAHSSRFTVHYRLHPDFVLTYIGG